MTQRTAYPIAVLVEAVRQQCAGRLAQELVGPYEGVAVRSIGALSHAKPDEVAFLANPKFIHEVKDCQAGVIVLRKEDKEAIYGDETPRAMVITPNPYAWFAFALQVVEKLQNQFASGIHPHASVAVTAKVDPTARVDAGAVIEDHAVVGARAWIGANSVVGVGSVIGDDTRLHPNVTALFGRVKMAGEIDLIANLDCVVSMDSLVMHLASLVATPVVSVWGATHPGLGFFGYGCDPRGIVQADMECRPCSVFGNKPCRYGDYRCLHAVTPAMIVERVEEIVGK